MSLPFDIRGRFESFINEFTDEEGNLKYRERIREMPRQGTRSLLISYNDLLHQDPRLAEEVLANPEECFFEGEKVLRDILTQLDPKYIERHYLFHIRIENLTDKVLLRTLKTEHLGYLTRFEGIVIGVTETKPLLIEGHFKCASCGTENQIVEFPEGLYSPPYQCRNDVCQRKGSLILQLEYSKFIDWQKITIQEKPEELPPGQLPQSISIHVLDDLVDQARPGDRVEVVGTLKARATRMFKRGQLATYNKFFNGVTITKETTEYVDIEITEKDREEIKEISESPYIIEKIRDSLAPSIYGHDVVKEAIACLLFGGAQKETPDGMKIRGESNILLIGDPGVGKCVHPESEIILATGARQRIGDLVESNITGKLLIDDGYFEYLPSSLMGMDKNGKLTKNASDMIWKRKSPKYLYSIKTLSGRKIKVTPTHPFFCCENGYIQNISAENLTVDNFIAVPRRIEVKGDNRIVVSYQKSKANNAIRLIPPKFITPWFAEFLGLFLAEGYSQNRGKSKSIWFCNSDESLLTRFKVLLKKFGVNYNQRLSSNKSAYDVYSGSSELYNFLEAFETSIVKKSKEKRVPNQLLRATDEIISIFLRALFDGEAHVDNSRPKIELASASYNLLSDVQILLLRFGIISHIKEKIIDMGTYYRLNITGLPNIGKFHEKIGFSLSYKDQRLSQFLSSSKTHNTNVDVIPNVGRLIRKIRTNAGLYQSDFSITRSAINHYERNDRNPSRRYLKTIVEDFRKKRVNGAATDRLEKISSTDIYWDKVIEIRKIPTDTKWVYDLQVPGVHNYIANGFFVHNSQILKFVARLAPRALYTTGKGSTAAGLCVSADSEVFLKGDIKKISSIVEKEMENGEIVQYNDDIEYKDVSESFEAIHSKNLKLESQPISRVWRIKTPEKLLKIKTKAGRELKLTKQTSVLSIDDSIGLVWKPANSLTLNDKVACPRNLPNNKFLDIPNTYELLKDYSKDIFHTDLTETVDNIITEIKYKLGFSNLTLANKLKVSEDTLYRWKSKKRKGGIPFSKFEELCCLLNEPVYKYLPDNLIVSIKKGQYIKLPKKLTQSWFYVMGLIAGDGRISKDMRTEGYGGVTIGFSNREESLLSIYRDFFKQIGLNSSISPGTDERPSECRIFSSIIYHIISKFGLSPSPKSNTIKLNNEILFYPNEYIYSLLRGLYDSDGWIYIRDEESSHIGFSSTNQSLIRFVQNALLKLGIIGYIRTKKPKTTFLKDGRSIESKLLRYEIYFNAFSDFVTFKKNIGFNHPDKRAKLDTYCSSKKTTHRNDDNIPEARVFLNEMFNFYNIHSRKVFGYKGALAPSRGHKSLSRPNFKKILSSTQFKWHNHRVELPDTMRNTLNKTLKENYSLKARVERLKILKTEYYDLFGRKNRKTKIPIGILLPAYRMTSKFLSNADKKILEDLIQNLKLKHEDYQSKLLFLKKLANSDILWDDIIEISEIIDNNSYVYDLSIPTTHNFIVNGVIVHNTAAVIRDQDTGEITLEAGALVLADQGIAMIDEFDKMRPDDRTAIHEAMEQHTISIAKAGIVATLNARTSILAAANPRRGRWNPYKATADNLNLPPTLLSRFDLIFVLEDKPNLKEDHDKATHILRIHKLRTLPIDPPIEQSLLRKYIAYARREVHPRLSDEAEARLLEFYTELRSTSGKIEEGRPDPIAITPRQLEALVRLAEARAKMRLSDIVTYEDASGAVNLLSATLEKLARDAETGKLDIDKYSSGMSDQGRRRLDRIDSLIDNMLKESEGGEPVSINAILEQAVEDGLDKSQVEKAITLMIRTGKLFEPQPGRVQKI